MTVARGNKEMISKRNEGAAPSGLLGVPRVRLVSRVFDGLGRGGLVALVADNGMGKHHVAAQVVNRARGLEYAIRSLRFSSHSIENSYRRLRRCSNELIDLSGSGGRCLMVVEGIPEMDDGLLCRVASVIEAAMLCDVQVLLLMEPVAEILLEELSCHTVLRASDFVVSGDELSAWRGALAGRTQDEALTLTCGVPSLLAALGGPCSIHGYPEDYAWVSASEQMLSRTLSGHYIEEEAKLRCAILALGGGTFADLRGLGLRVSPDILRQLELDAPLLGICARTASFSSFRCAPELIGRLLKSACSSWPWVVDRAVGLLASRGNLRRAGMLASSCPGYTSTHALALAYPVELVDAGLAAMVVRSLTGPESSESEDASLAAKALCLVGVTPWGGAPSVSPASAGALRPKARGVTPGRRAAVGLQVALLEALHDVRVGLMPFRDTLERVGALSTAASSSGDRVAKILACHLEAVTRLYGGAPLEAFRTLMLSRSLREQEDGYRSAFASLLQCDFEVTRRLVGDSDNPRDRKAIRVSRSCLSELGPKYVYEQAEYTLEATAFLAGQTSEVSSGEGALARYALRGERAALALGHAVAAFSDASSRLYRRAYVHAVEGREEARAVGFSDVESLLGIAVRLIAFGLGESSGLLLEGFAAPGGSVRLLEGPTPAASCTSRDIGALCALHAAVWEGERSDYERASAHLREISPRAVAITLAGFIGHVDRVRGSLFLRALPSVWRGGASVVPTSAKPAIQAVMPAFDAASGTADGSEPIRLKIDVLGGFGVTIGGRKIAESAWRRKHARTLLAMLALTPGHGLARYEAAERFWPEADYARCRSSMYTVISSLRSTLGQAGPEGYVRGEMGRLWLDAGTVSCDIDEFEELTRLVIARGSDGEDAVAQCIRIEEMYGGGTMITSDDSSGFFRRRHDEMSRRYVDALLVGVSAALGVGDTRQAVWFAQSARGEDPEREDVKKALAWALRGDVHKLVGGSGEAKEGKVTEEAA